MFDEDHTVFYFATEQRSPAGLVAGYTLRVVIVAEECSFCGKTIDKCRIFCVQKNKKREERIKRHPDDIFELSYEYIGSVFFFAHTKKKRYLFV